MRIFCGFVALTAVCLIGDAVWHDAPFTAVLGLCLAAALVGAALGAALGAVIQR